MIVGGFKIMSIQYKNIIILQQNKEDDGTFEKVESFSDIPNDGSGDLYGVLISG
jgi:hypothetical protein